MRQTGRFNINSGNNSCSCEWLLMLLVLGPGLTAAQYASSIYSSQFYGYNQQQQPQEQQQQQQELPQAPGLQVPGLQQQSGYLRPPLLTYNQQQYPATADVQSIWSGGPIVVRDEPNSLHEQEERQQQQDQRYSPINYGYNYNYNNNNVAPPPPTRAANHNYNNAGGYFYYTQQPQPQPQQQQLTQQELEQRELLEVADSQRDEEQVVHIGGTRSLAHYNSNNNNYNNNNYNNYYEAAAQAKYAKHYADYLRKYPQRLQPLYNTGGTRFVDK